MTIIENFKLMKKNNKFRYIHVNYKELKKTLQKFEHSHRRHQ